MIRLGVLGPGGRMGHSVVTLAQQDPEFSVQALIASPQSELVGKEVAGCEVTTALEGLAQCDVYIDFTTPQATGLAAHTAAKYGTAAVVGTTGLTSAQLEALTVLSKKAGVLTAPNFSVGVNVLLGLAERAARALGPDFDLEVVELHHKRKRDAPSGTAIALGEALARGRDVDYHEVANTNRSGADVGARPQQEIGVFAVRGGDIIGEHTAFLIGERERLEITHRAQDRSLFAAGALRAARWLANKPAGSYTMTDVLGLDRIS